jgi:hypothetical protein
VRYVPLPLWYSEPPGVPEAQATSTNANHRSEPGPTAPPAAGRTTAPDPSAIPPQPGRRLNPAASDPHGDLTTPQPGTVAEESVTGAQTPATCSAGSRPQGGNHRQRPTRPSSNNSSSGSPAPTTRRRGAGRPAYRRRLGADAAGAVGVPGARAGRRFFTVVAFRQSGPYRLVATRANGQPAFGAHVRDPTPRSYRRPGCQACAMTLFDNRVLARLGVPRTLPNWARHEHREPCPPTCPTITNQQARTMPRPCTGLDSLDGRSTTRAQGGRGRPNG